MSPKQGEQVAFLTEFSSGPSKTPLIRGHRSKGCMTCRRRKVKCDERRPTCERCEKGFHKCLGYDKPLVFVQHSGQAGGSSKGQPLQSPTVVTPSEQGSEEWNIICFDQSKSSVSEAETQVPPTMQLNAFQDEIVISHLLESFHVGFGDRFTRGTDAPTWRRILTTGKGKSNAYVAGLGLAEAFFGKVHKMNSLVQHSAKLYGQALRSLRDDLQLIDNGIGRDRAYMNLWNSAFLVLYELVASGNMSSWLQHSRGVAALTHILGPEAFQTPIANSMLETFRTTITISSIAQRKYCFLADEEWKTIPWAREDVPKSVTSKINDVMCDVPGLMESVDVLHELESQGLDVEYKRVPLQNRILTTLQKLMALRWQWEFANSRACWAEPIDMRTTSSVDMQGKPLFDTVLRYEFFDQAVNIVYFNATRLMLYGLQDGAGLEDEFVSAVLETGPPGPHSNALLLPGQGDRLDHILEICRSVDYCLQASLEYQGALQLLFPLRVAHGYASYLDPKLATWIGQILVQLATSNGFQMGKHVLEMGRYPSPKLPVRE